MIPLGSMCVIVPPAYQAYVGGFVTVFAYTSDEFFPYAVEGNCLPCRAKAHDRHLRVIRPPHSAQPAPPVTRDEPVTA